MVKASIELTDAALDGKIEFNEIVCLLLPLGQATSSKSNML